VGRRKKEGLHPRSSGDDLDGIPLQVSAMFREVGGEKGKEKERYKIHFAIGRKEGRNGEASWTVLCASLRDSLAGKRENL